MTEISDTPSKLPDTIERFVLHWGEMGQLWGVNRSVAQIHALLYVAERAKTAEEIAAELGLARSNVSTSLKELVGWNLVRRVSQMGDRRDYFEAEADMFEMVRRIAIGRKAREIDPTLALLRACVAESSRDPSVSSKARGRLAEMLNFMEVVDHGFDEIMRLPGPTLLRLMKMGGALARFANMAMPDGGGVGKRRRNKDDR